MLRAVIFDFNGIIVDDEPIHFRLFQRVFAEEGIEFNTEHIHSQIDWKLYHQVWENKDFYLLFFA